MSDKDQARSSVDESDNRVWVGRNWYPRDLDIKDRSTDDSLGSRDRVQSVVPPNSLVWKYFGDMRVQAGLGMRVAIIENMFPQLGQGVSDHSVLFSGHGNFLERARRSSKPIQSVVYADPTTAEKRALQVRNFHKSIKGDMPDGRRYHAINAETYYWAHVTFFEAIFRASDLGMLGKKLTREEKAQIFEESKEWYSMYGVSDSAQPQTYDEFELYLDDVLKNQLVANGMSETSVKLSVRSFANKKIVDSVQNMKGVNPFVAKHVLGRLVPLIGWYVRLTTLGSLGPYLRELGRHGDAWTARDERQFRWLVKFLRLANRISDRFVPYRYYYSPEAVAGFQREGINPHEITLESARSALAQARSERPGWVEASDGDDHAVVKVSPQELELLLDGTHHCAQCDRPIDRCVECTGSGMIVGDACEVCLGRGAGCPVHHAEWMPRVGIV